MRLRVCDGEREQVGPASLQALEQALAPGKLIREGSEIALSDGERWLAALAVSGSKSDSDTGEFLLSGDDLGAGYGKTSRGQVLRRFREFLIAQKSRSVARPDPSEVPSFHRAYLAEVSGEDIGRQLVEQLGLLERRLGGLAEEAASYRYAPGKWSIKEVLGHMTDAERIFSYRLLRIGRGDRTPLPGFDENAYVPAGRFDGRALSSLLSEFHSVRMSTIALIEALPEEQWNSMGNSNGEPVTARGLAYVLLGHVAHHLKVLRDRYNLT